MAFGGFGFSPTDIVGFGKTCLKIYNAFADEYDNAPRTVQRLVDNCKYLSDSFDDVKTLAGNALPPILSKTIGDTIKKCEKFLDNYKRLKADYSSSHRTPRRAGRVSNSVSKAIQIGSFAIMDDDDKAKELTDTLGMEIMKLLLYINLNCNTKPSTTFRQISGVQGITDQVQGIGAEVRRLGLEGHPEHPRLLEFDRQINEIWKEIYKSVGSADGQGPGIIHVNRLITGPNQESRSPTVYTIGTLSENGRSDTSGTWPPRLATALSSSPSPQAAPHPHQSPALGMPSPQPPPSILASNVSGGSVSSSSPAPNTSFTTTPSVSSQPTPWIGTPMLPLPPSGFIATIKLPGVGTVKLQCWEEKRDEAKSVLIVWTAQEPRGRLEHHVPKCCYPQVLHSRIEPKRVLQFPENVKHTLTWESQDAPVKRLRFHISPKYVFTKRTWRDEFQSPFRQKKMVESYDTEAVWTSRNGSSRDHAESRIGIFKIWQDRRHLYSLSIYNTLSSPNRHEECLLSHFDECTISTEKDACVKLHLNPNARRSSSVSTQSSDKSREGRSRSFPSLQWGSHSSNAKGKAPTGHRDSLPVAPQSQPPPKKAVLLPEFFDGLEYLCVEFSVTKDDDGKAISGTDVASKFKTQFATWQTDNGKRTTMDSSRFGPVEFAGPPSVMGGLLHDEPGESSPSSPLSRQIPSMLLGFDPSAIGSSTFATGT